MMIWRKATCSAVVRSTLAVVGIMLLFACKEMASFAFEPYQDVQVVATVTRLSHHDFATMGPTTFVHFRYVVTRRSDEPLYFKVENVSLSVNGVRNKSAYYDSVASIPPHWRQLEERETEINAYASFPGTLDPSSITRVEFGDLGFTRKPNDFGVNW